MRPDRAALPPSAGAAPAGIHGSPRYEGCADPVGGCHATAWLAHYGGSNARGCATATAAERPARKDARLVRGCLANEPPLVSRYFAITSGPIDVGDPPLP